MLVLSDFNISGKPIPEYVADKIYLHHLIPLNEVASVVNFGISVSQKSGYRDKEWELAHGRNGTSQHTFDGKGAVDLTCDNFAKNKHALLTALKLHTNYKRIADYGTFYHLDYKGTERALFNKRWEKIRNL